MNAMDLGAKIIIRRAEDTIDPGLWISVDEREPSALNLEHHSVSRFERMANVSQRDRDRCDLI